MQWQRVDDYAQRSACGRYTVAAIGTAGGWFQYAAWRTPLHDSGRQMLGLHKTQEAARKACEEDCNAPS